ncbi:MAG: potassium-transporting ATPase subunit KdpC [Desulfovibrio sp.]|nr:potassium-transporting ATPase subunit KdpC [Desulfovibrio sp.]MBI4959325.1 potassium-transporting ATPase subunit KdpC [Desulfovibrio sp.]
MYLTIIKQLKPAVLMLFWMTIITGLVYPLAMTGLGKTIFPVPAGGSLVESNGVVVGSSLIGQHFDSEGYFKGRPSATSPYEYNAESSSGSNLGPSNPALAEAVADRVKRLADANGGGNFPIDMVTTSGSGLDPHISPEAANYQADRVAKARGMTHEAVSALVEKHTQGRLWGFWGEARVNVLELNLDLDALPKKE